MNKGWKKIKIKDITDIKKGSYITKNESKPGPYPVILGGQEPAYYINKYNHQGKAIVISRSGASAGYVSFWNENIYVTDGFLIEPKDNISYEYLYYLLKSKQNELHNLQRGAAIPHVTPTLLYEVDIELPPFSTREKIGSILRNYDNLIENNQAQIKLLEEAAQRLYKEWFVDLRFPGYEKVRIVDGVPEGWKLKPLFKVFEYVRGKSYTSNDLVETGGVLMANLKNIKAFGGYNRNAEKHFAGKYKDTQKLQAGDIIMGVTDMTQERRLVGYVAIVPNTRLDMTFSMDLIKIIPLSVTKSFLYSTMIYGGYSKKISLLANGVNVLHLKPEAMKNIEILVPPNDVMEQYEKIFEPYHQKIEILQEHCDVAEEARNRLLPKLMSGELEV